MAGVHVPDELIENILLKVPVKSLVRFKAASKKWYSLLSDCKFVDFHLKQSSSSSSSENLIFFQISTVKPIFVSMDIDTNESRKFSFPVENGSCELIGSANGLVCVDPYFKGSCYIWNPTTGECKKISASLLNAASRLCGFGYDSYSDDYKVVAECPHFSIFSLKTNSWKTHEYSFAATTNVLHLNGALHWCDGSYVVTFDFATEEMSHMLLPQEMKQISKEYLNLSLLDYQGLLCVCGGMSIWVMKEYGSWAKLTCMLKRFAKPFAISRLGEVVYVKGDRSGIIKSDLHGKVSYDYVVQMGYVAPLNAFAYTESLISPMHFDSQPESKKIMKTNKTNAI